MSYIPFGPVTDLEKLKSEDEGVRVLEMQSDEPVMVQPLHNQEVGNFVLTDLLIDINIPGPARGFS